MPQLFVEDVDDAYLVDLRSDESLVLGRSPDADLRVASPRASRRHVEIRAATPGHVAVDLGSTNGTSVNGARLEAERRLEDGDVIDVAGCFVVYRRGA